MAKQLVLSGNRIIAHGEDCFLSMGGTVICTKSGRKFDNATVTNTTSAIPADIDEVGYEYRAGEFIPCAPFGRATGGTIPLLCDDCKTMKDSGVRGENLSSVMNNGLTLSFLPSIDLPETVGSSSDIVTGQGKIIILGSTSYQNNYLSKDGGETWETITLPFTNSRVVAYDKTLDIFVVVATSSTSSTGYNKAAYSKDGVNWTAVTLPTNRPFCSLAAGNGMFIAGALNGYIAYSTDGKTWTDKADRLFSNTYARIEFDPRNNLFVAVTSSNSSGRYSRDGETWSAVGGTISLAPDGVCIGNGKYLLFDYDGEIAVRASSSLGTSNAWTTKTIPAMSGGKYEYIFFANGLFFSLPNVALTDAVAEMAVSADGLTWEVVKTPKIASRGVVHDGNKFIAISTGTGVIDSYDGKSWLVRGEYRLRMANGDDVTGVVKNMLA